MEVLSSLLLRFVQEENDTVELREMLSGSTHRCRNLLNGMKMSLYFVRQEADGPLPRRLTEVEEAYGWIECLLRSAPADLPPVSLTPVRRRISAASWAIEAAGAKRSETPRPKISRSSVPFQESEGEFDPSHLGLGLDSFVSWRAASVATDDTATVELGEPTTVTSR